MSGVSRMSKPAHVAFGRGTAQQFHDAKQQKQQKYQPTHTDEGHNEDDHHHYDSYEDKENIHTDHN